MTRDQIVSLVTSTVGQTDTTSVTLCNSYVQQAYQMVWNAELWQDTVDIDTSATITVGVNTFSLPSGFERVVSIQALSGGVPVSKLEPVTSTFILETDPTALTTNGVPAKYEEFNSSGTKKVRIFPKADGTYAFTMSAKRSCPTLSGSDSLAIRNVDNAVIALATADMYTRMRQLGKAGEMAKKAGAFLDEARAIEKEQSNKPRLAKTPTVTTNTFAELVDAVCERAGSFTPDSVIIARNAVKRRYRMIYDSFLWKDSITTTTASTVGLQAYISMPAGMERVISLMISGVMLDPVDAAYLFQTSPDSFGGSGQATAFQEVDVSGVKRINLYPIPDAIYLVYITGKKTATNLSADADVPVIRNVDTALIAFAASDLAARLGNADGSKTALEEAVTALAALKDLESQQTFRERKAKPLTVTTNALSEMIDTVCARANSYAIDSVILARSFLKRRYRMIWDSYLWRDSTTTATASTTSSQAYIATPATIERVISVSINGKLLDPVDASYLAQAGPDIVSGSGTPTAWEETDAAGVKRINLYPIPDAVYSVTITGKKPITNLSSDTDVPRIRNVDTALLAFATSDLQQRVGNMDGAKASLDEAAAALSALKDLEGQQTVRARMAKPLTVSGNSLQELADAVCSRTSQWTMDAQILAKEFLRRNYQMVYDSQLWSESLVEITYDSVLDVLVLPLSIDRVISIRGTSTLGQLSNVQPSFYYGVTPQIFEQTGDPLAFNYLTPSATLTLPVTGVDADSEKVEIASNSASDKSPVFIRGEVNGTPEFVREETVVLNGTTPVQSVGSYSVLLTVAKQITAGTVLITGVDTDVLLGALMANERERKHIRIQLRPTPTANVTCRLLCKRRLMPFVTNEDTPMLRDIGNVLINLASSDMFMKIGDKDSAAVAKAKADEALKALVALEQNQGAWTGQVVPEIAYCDDTMRWSDCGWLTKAP